MRPKTAAESGTHRHACTWLAEINPDQRSLPWSAFVPAPLISLPPSTLVNPPSLKDVMMQM